MALQGFANVFHLREASGPDYLYFFELFNDPDIISQYGQINNSLEIANFFVKSYREKIKNRKAFLWVISSRAWDDFIGFVRIEKYDDDFLANSFQMTPLNILRQEIKEDDWEIDFALRKPYRGIGIMKDLLPEILNYCKTQNIKAVYAKVKRMTNKPSILLLKGTGFNAVWPMMSEEATKEYQLTGRINENECGFVYRFKFE